MRTSFEHLIWEVEGQVAVLTINRPEVLNALNADVLEELDEWSTQIHPKLEQSSNPIRCIVLQGAGSKAFVAGADIKEFKGKTKVEAQAVSTRGQRIFAQIEQLPVPTVALVEGYALGGGAELAIACDFRLAAPNAIIGFPEVKLGLIPGFGGTVRLPRLIGYAKAMEWMTTAKTITAKQGVDVGIFNAILEQENENMLDQAKEWITPLCSMAPLAIKSVIFAIKSQHNTYSTQFFEKEATLFGALFETHDFEEGVNAFLEKRNPGFQNK